MRSLLLVALFLGNAPAFAAAPVACAPKAGAPKPAADAGEAVAHVVQLDADFPVEKFQRKGLAVHPLAPRNHARGLPPRVVQEQIFRDAGLKDVLTWDPLEQDLLFGAAGEQSAERVAKKYEGRLPAAAVKELGRLIGDYRAEEGKR